MSVLVYVGANQGNALASMVHGYDKVYAFEPDPVTYEELKGRFGQLKNVTLINAACAEEYGETDFYILPCRASSSMSIPDDDFIAHCENEGNLKAIEVGEPITVKTINLCQYLQSEGVNHIDYYVSDIQGFDLKVLKTMSPYLESGDIDELYMETHGDNQKCYVGLKNDLSSFKDILSDKYEIEYISLGRLGGRRIPEEGLDSIPQQNDKGELEFDVKWKKK